MAEMLLNRSTRECISNHLRVKANYLLSKGWGVILRFFWWRGHVCGSHQRIGDYTGVAAPAIRLLAVFLWTSVAWAGTPTTWKGYIEDVPTWITIVPRGHEISAETERNEPWWKWGNAQTDAYLFAFDTPENVQLIVEFTQDLEGQKANFYVKDWGRGVLEYSLDGDELTILSNGGNPNIVLQPTEGDWLVNDFPNYNVRMWEDGFVESFRLQFVKPDELVPDGNPELLTVVGTDASLIPKWSINNRIFDPHPSWGGFRFGATLRLPDASEFKAATPLMPTFPFLSISGKAIDWFKENPNPIYYDLRRRSLITYPFIGFQTGGTYWINSDTPPPYVSFESPFAFYSFDRTTRQAHMIIRAESYPADSPFGPEPKNFTRTAFRYSWKTRDNEKWSYGIHVAGQHEYDEDITIGDVTFRNVSMERLPMWITRKPWPLITFVEPTEGFTGSEGIYFYNANDPKHLPWLSGVSLEPEPWLEAPYLNESASLGGKSGEGLPPGFRGEYNAAYFRRPLLYFSPIDNRLHLTYAQGGVWHLSQENVLRYHNLDGDRYIDGWTLERVPKQKPERMDLGLGALAQNNEVGTLEKLNADFVPMALPGDVQEGIFALGGYLIYYDAATLEVRKADYRLQTFFLRPPTNRASWERFRDTIAPYEGNGRSPYDLKSWLAAFPGESLNMSGVRVSAFRATSKGFRFTLTLDEQVALGGTLDIPALRELSAGMYVVSYRQNSASWSVQPAREPTLITTLEAPEFRAYFPGTLSLTLFNSGNLDWEGEISLQVGELETFYWRNLFIPGGKSRKVTVDWSPAKAGEFRTSLVVGDQVRNLGSIVVDPTRRIEPLQAIWLPAGTVLQRAVLIVLLGLLVVGVSRIRRFV